MGGPVGVAERRLVSDCHGIDDGTRVFRGVLERDI